MGIGFGFNSMSGYTPNWARIAARHTEIQREQQLKEAETLALQLAQLELQAKSMAVQQNTALKD